MIQADEKLLGERAAWLESLGAELLGPRRLRLHYRPSQMPFSSLLTQLQQAGLAIHDLTTQDADLEDLFLELTRSRAA